MPLQIPTLRRVAADNSAFRAVSAIRRIAKTADGCEPLQVPTFLKVGEGLKYGGRSGSSDTTDIKQQILIVGNIKCFKKGKVKTK